MVIKLYTDARFAGSSMAVRCCYHAESGVHHSCHVHDLVPNYQDRCPDDGAVGYGRNGAVN